MFLLRDLPTRSMIERYAAAHAPGKAATIEQTLAALRQASRLIRRLDTFFAAHDISLLRFLILMVIDREPNRDWLTFSEIADRIDVSRPVLSRTIKSLRAAELLTETADTKDARITRLSISADGQARFDSLLPDYFAILADADALEKQE